MAAPFPIAVYAVLLLCLIASAPSLAAAHGIDIPELYGVLGVSEPSVLPGNWLYGLKELGRNVRRAFAFGALARANLELKISSEKLAEFKKLIAVKSDDNATLERGLKNYLDALPRLAAKISATAGRSNAFATEAFPILLRHAAVVDAIGSAVSVELAEDAKGRLADTLTRLATIGVSGTKEAIDAKQKSAEPEDRELLEVLEYFRGASDSLDAALTETGIERGGVTPQPAGTLPPPVVPPPPEGAGKGCVIAGCSSELCVLAESGLIASPCIFKPEFACYKNALCKVQPSGQCGWTQTPELAACLRQP